MERREVRNSCLLPVLLSFPSLLSLFVRLRRHHEVIAVEGP